MRAPHNPSCEDRGVLHVTCSAPPGFSTPPQWYILQTLAGCRSLAGLPAHVSSEHNRLQRDYPIQPYTAELEPADRAAGFEAALCFPGDDAHPVFPGPAGARHRMVMAVRSTGTPTQHASLVVFA